MKTDYYELLGVSQEATDSELKKAYRKRALQLHPDKNPDDIENATRLFNEIRLAYETLKDPQERSWYDSHKFQILMEDSDRGGVGYDDDEQEEVYYQGTSLFDIQSYMNPALYQRFDDSIQGFYSVVSVLLDKLASEEVTAGKQQNLNGFSIFKDNTQFATVCDPKELLFPRIGNSKNSFDETRMFYKIWSSFQSVKTFNWCDEYRYSSAPDRRTRRLMEKENKKLRDQARKEYNETVRKFIAFIKKLDPRMDPQLKKKFEREKQNQKMEELKRQAEVDKMKRREQRSKFVEQDWQTIDPDDLADIEEELFRIHEEERKLNGGDGLDDDLDGDINSYECIICNKTFKSEKQFQDHERSKKHLKLLKQLQWEMKREGIELGIDNEKFVDIDENGDILSNDEFEDALDDLTDLDDLDLDDLSDLNDEEIQQLIEKELEQQNNSNAQQSVKKSFEELEIDDDLDEDDKDDYELQNESIESEIGIDTGIKPKPKGKMSKEEEKLAELEKLLGKPTFDDSSDDEWASNTKSKLKKKNKRKDKKDSSSNNIEQNLSPQTTPSSNEVCTVCNESFASRNKLFQHVNATGHAAAPKKSKKGKRGKKK